MAVTYKLIASNTLTSDTASVTFSSIPNTYTDLVLRMSARGTRTGFDYEDILFRFNSDTGSNYSRTIIRGSGSAVISGRSTNTGFIAVSNAIPGPTATSNTFGSLEIYIPNYTSTSTIPVSVFAVEENNTTEAYLSAQASQWRGSAAINEITFTKTDNYAAGSSFFLYGIKAN